MADTNTVVDVVEVESNFNDTPVKKKFRYRDISGGILLILLGGVFLLNTLGYLPWSVWSGFFITMLRFWPILIIFLGIRIVFGSNRYLKIFSDVLWIFVLLLAFALSIVNYSGDSIIREKLLNRFPFLVTINQTLNISNNEKSGDIKVSKAETDTYKNVDLKLNVIAGEFSLTDKDISDYLTLNSRYSENGGIPSVSETKGSETLSLEFKQEYKPMVLNFNSKGTYKMVIGEKIPVKQLSLNLTAGTSNFDLKKVKVSNSDIKMTAGDTTLSFTEESLPETINIKLVAGSLDINLPGSVGVEVRSKSVAGDIRFNKTKLTENGTSQFNIDRAKKVIIDVDQTAGDISITTK